MANDKPLTWQEMATENLRHADSKRGKDMTPDNQPALPSTGPYVDRLCKIFRDQFFGDTSAMVLRDYAIESIRHAEDTTLEAIDGHTILADLRKLDGCRGAIGGTEELAQMYRDRCCDFVRAHEKTIVAAFTALESLRRAEGAGSVVYRPHDGECHGPWFCKQCSLAVGFCFAGDRATVNCVKNCPCPQWPESKRHAALPVKPSSRADGAPLASDVAEYQQRFWDGSEWSVWHRATKECYDASIMFPAEEVEVRKLYAAPAEGATLGEGREQALIDREEVLKDYVADYEMIGETEDGSDAYYQPNERERALIEDAIRGWDALELQEPTCNKPTQNDGLAAEIDMSLRLNKPESETEYCWSALLRRASGSLRATPTAQRVQLDRHCQNGRADVCRASQRDGVVCPADSCDIDDGVREPDAAQRVAAGDDPLKGVADAADYLIRNPGDAYAQHTLWWRINQARESITPPPTGEAVAWEQKISDSWTGGPFSWEAITREQYDERRNHPHFRDYEFRQLYAHPAAQAEPIAWESTTVCYTQFVTDSSYRNFSAEAQRWYKPYRCSSCTAAQAEGRGVAVAWIDQKQGGAFLRTLGECRALEDLPHGTKLYRSALVPMEITDAEIDKAMDAHAGYMAVSHMKIEPHAVRERNAMRAALGAALTAPADVGGEDRA